MKQTVKKVWKGLPKSNHDSRQKDSNKGSEEENCVSCLSLKSSQRVAFKILPNPSIVLINLIAKKERNSTLFVSCPSLSDNRWNICSLPFLELENLCKCHVTFSRSELYILKWVTFVGCFSLTCQSNVFLRLVFPFNTNQIPRDTEKRKQPAQKLTFSSSTHHKNTTIIQVVVRDLMMVTMMIWWSWFLYNIVNT